MAFVFRAVDEVGATLNAALVVMGDKLGYYRALADGGPLTPARAGRAHRDRRAVRPGVAQRAGRRRRSSTYDPATGTLHAAARARGRADRRVQPGVPARLLPDRARHRRATPPASSRRRAAATASAGTSTTPTCTSGCERFFRPGYLANLVDAWLPALDGVVDKLERGATVADIGCGHGASTVLMARRSRRSTFVGSDYHAASIETARERAADGRRRRPGRRSRWRRRSGFPARGYDLVTTFDALHDMGDPVGAARHVHDALADDGTWMIVEPMAGDQVEDNLNPVGRAYYGFSTLLCTPASLSQEVGLALGTQAGPARIRDVTDRGRASPGSGRWPRRRSTRCSRSGSEPSGDDTTAVAAGPAHTGGDGRSRRRRCARGPGRAGFVVRDGVRLAYEVFGDAAHDRAADADLVDRPVAGLEGPGARTWPGTSAWSPSTAAGSGGSDRPSGAAAYTDEEYRRGRARRAGRHRDRPGRARSASRAASLVGARWRSGHPERVAGIVAIGPRSCGFRARRSGNGTRSSWSRPTASPHRGLGEVQPALLARGDYEDFLRFFFGADVHRAALDQADRGLRRRGGTRSRPETPGRHHRRPARRATARCASRRAACAAGPTCPVLVIHGTEDPIRPHADGERLAELTGGTLLTPRGRGPRHRTRATRSWSTELIRAVRRAVCPPTTTERRGDLGPRPRPADGGARSTCPPRSGSATPAATSRSPTSCARCTRTCRSTGWPRTR